jgi:hypothetical protein
MQQQLSSHEQLTLKTAVRLKPLTRVAKRKEFDHAR